jgi:hypothetical protein
MRKSRFSETQIVEIFSAMTSPPPTPWFTVGGAARGPWQRAAHPLSAEGSPAAGVYDLGVYLTGELTAACGCSTGLGILPGKFDRRGGIFSTSISVPYAHALSAIGRCRYRTYVSVNANERARTRCANVRACPGIMLKSKPRRTCATSASRYGFETLPSSWAS